MLTELQEKFCQLVALYGYNMAEAAKKAGYRAPNSSSYYSVGKRLIDKKQISDRIAEIRSQLFDTDAVRRSIILDHMQTRYFKVTDYIHHERYVTDTGEVRYRVIVKPYDEWDETAKRMCLGFDKNGIPIFRNLCDADKELCRIFGLYKENQVREEEDTSSVLASAGLTPSLPATSSPFYNPIDEMLASKLAPVAMEYDCDELDDNIDEEFGEDRNPLDMDDEYDDANYEDVD